MLQGTIRNDDFYCNNMALKVEGDVTSYKGRFLAQLGQQTGFWDGVAQKN